MVRIVYCFADVQVHYFVIFNVERSTEFARILALICINMWYLTQTCWETSHTSIRPLIVSLKIPWHNLMKFELEICATRFRQN